MKSQRNKSCKDTVSKSTASWQYKPLVSAVLTGMVTAMLPLSVSNSVLASELDVYEKNGADSSSSSPTLEGQGGPKVMLMLSTTASMGCDSIFADYNSEVGDIPSRGRFDPPPCTETKKTVNVGGKNLEYKEISYKGKLSRKDRALQGLLYLLDHPDDLPPGTSLGLSYYGFDAGQTNVINVNHDFDASTYDVSIREEMALKGQFYEQGRHATGQSLGMIAVPIIPVRNLDGTPNQANINKLKEAAIRMVPAANNVPMAAGFAEAMAYFMGSSTLDRDIKKGEGKKVYPIRYSTLKNRFELCLVFNQQGKCLNNASAWVPLVSPWKEQYLDLMDKDGDKKPIKVKGSDVGIKGSTGKYDHYQYTTIQYSRNKTEYRIDAGILYSNPESTNGAVTVTDLVYNSPLVFRGDSGDKKNQCSATKFELQGNAGFYFLTDGLPNRADQSKPLRGVGGGSDKPERIYTAKMQMENAFKNSSMGIGSFSCLPDGSDYQGESDLTKSESGAGTNLGRSGWNCMLAAAKKLSATDNKYPPIRTAIAGFGKTYSDIMLEKDFPALEKKNFKDNGFSKLTDCSNLSDANPRDKYLACDWGQKKYGGGGFYIVNTGSGLAKSIQNFIDSIKDGKNVEPVEYSAQQGDGLTVAADVTDATTSSNFAFLPLMLPRPGSNQLLWAGNVNKYKVKNGSLFDKNNKHIYDNVSGQIKLDTTELWNNSGNPDGGVVRPTEVKKKVYQPAGTYAQLKAPNSTSKDSTRTVYVEKANGGMQKISVTGNRPAGFDSLGYDFQKQQYLLNFLGYDVPVFAAGKRITADDYDSTKDGVLKDSPNPMNNTSSYVPTDSVRILGGINNSKPQEVLYRSVETKSGKTNTAAVLYGSLDGALHLADGETGEELFAFIPKPVVTSDRNIAALKNGSTQLADGTNNETGKIAYGVDAPWYVDVLLNRKYESDKVTYSTDPIEGAAAGHIHAYGGLGRGGMGFYGLNITDKNKPELMFSIDNTKSGFESLGNTWSKPTKAKIQYKNASETVNKDVLFVTGGYDLCYDNADFKLNTINTDWKVKEDQTGVSCSSKSKTLGNAVYMIDANNGKLLWAAKLEGSAASGIELKDKSPTTSAGSPYLKYSIPGEAAVIDTNRDGYVDSIYFADLGGQVFRADFSGEYVQNTGIKSKVTRILDTSSSASGSVPLRFFQRPVVSAYRFDITRKNGETTQITPNSKGTNQVQIVSVASGDRNSPLSQLPAREVGKQTNKLISVWNADKISDTDTEEGAAKLSSGSDFIQLDFSKAQDMSVADKTKLINGTVKGWYDNLTYFKGNTVQDTSSDRKIQSRTDDRSDAVGENINYLRAFGQPVIKGSRLFVSVYNNQAYIPAPPGSCSPVPTGVTEAQEYCMPFGTCINGRGGAHTLGPGIGSVNFAGIENGSNEFALVTPTEIKKTGGGSGTPSATGGGGKLEEEKGIFASLYDLLPHRWFERLPFHK